MVVVRDGVLGGMKCAIYRWWKKADSAYDPEIAGTVTHTRWLQMKRVYKLCDNKGSAKKGDDDYDPAYKYEYIYKCLVRNVNEVTLFADLDLCGDETTCGHGGFGEAGSGILARRMNKPGITFGMQTVLVSDVNRNRPRAYTHRHKVWGKIEGWNKEGPCEVRRIVEMLEAMVIGGPSNKGARQIFSEKPHSTWGNHFSGDQIMDYLGEKGFAATMTCQRNRLPNGIDDCYLHKEKTVPKCKIARTARFNKPITLVKKTTKKGKLPVVQVGDPPPDPNVQPADITWTRVHVTFQSTSSTNISTVNALNANQLFVRQKERGRGSAKRKWAIEMNEGRQLYLASYGRIDTIDSLIKGCDMYYVSWKYWHASKLHVQALGLVVAYDMYKEVVEEGYASFGFETKEEATKKCMVDVATFRDKLSLQGLRYNPEDCKYPGDKRMRVNTKKSKSSDGKKPRGRPRKNAASVTPDPDDVAVRPGFVTKKQFQEEKKRPESRLCGDLSQFTLHKASIIHHTYQKICKWCGKPCHPTCGICKLPCHDDPKKGDFTGLLCFFEIHNDQQFGLAITDCPILKKPKTDWAEPTTQEEEANSRHINDIKRKVPYNLRGRTPSVEDSI